jgi:hypothetical protein
MPDEADNLINEAKKKAGINADLLTTGAYCNIVLFKTAQRLKELYLC